MVLTKSIKLKHKHFNDDMVLEKNDMNISYKNLSKTI